MYDITFHKGIKGTVPPSQGTTLEILFKYYIEKAYYLGRLRLKKSLSISLIVIIYS